MNRPKTHADSGKVDLRKAVRRRALAIAFGLILACIVLGVGEIAVRSFLPKREPLWTFAMAPYLAVQMDNDITRQSQEYDPRRTWKVRANLRNQEWVGTLVTTNAIGLRMDREVGPKRPGEYRIVVAGDSVTFGYCVPFFWEGKLMEPLERPYPEVLEKLLRKKFRNEQIQVIPVACPGYSSLQGLLWLETILPTLEPDLVWVCYGWNDIMEVTAPDRRTMPQTFFPLALRHLGEHSQMILHAVAALPKPKERINGDVNLPRTTLEDYIANHATMARMTLDKKMEFGIISPAYRDATTFPYEAARMIEYRRKLREFAELNNIPFLEVPELTEKSPIPNQDFFMEHIHPNHVGHRMLAERLAPLCEEIMRRKMP